MQVLNLATLAKNHWISYPKSSRVLVHHILSEHHFAVSATIGGQGPQWFLAPLAGVLVGGGNHTAATGLHQAKTDSPDLYLFPTILGVRLTPGDNKVGSKPVHGQPLGQAAVEIGEGFFGDQEKGRGVGKTDPGTRTEGGIGGADMTISHVDQVAICLEKLREPSRRGFTQPGGRAGVAPHGNAGGDGLGGMEGQLQAGPARCIQAEALPLDARRNQRKPRVAALGYEFARPVRHHPAPVVAQAELVDHGLVERNPPCRLDRIDGEGGKAQAHDPSPRRIAICRVPGALRGICLVDVTRTRALHVGSSDREDVGLSRPRDAPGCKVAASGARQ